MLCPVCQTNSAIKDDYYGYLPCKPCQDRQSKLKKPGGQIEFTSDDIKEQRKSQANDIEQQHRKGVLNKKWLDLYGKHRAREYGYSDKEIKEAKYVYSGANTYYREDN